MHTKLDKQERGLSFESWKKEKNLMYRKLLKEAKENKQQELQNKSQDVEHNKFSQEIIKEKEIQQGSELSTKQIEESQQINILKEMNEKHITNNQIWRKDTKLKQAKLIMTKNPSYLQLKRSMGSSVKLINRSNSQFDSWLNQLDNILHQKYLRERRHLVRSFYCQPTYYGIYRTTKCYT
ncbi:synaptonemal complex protein 1-like isoform X2 [Monomorium pharaonis]|uniref:synaptonemal complex protein 1-like isoform X2 n=1 Tax=Monomorium pharaonis TaxID=307658 RepID=UPI001747021E|nr:synaptonemal complex protein 1-like isoform X2 [Monomorium pharaonis]